jgi:iron complex outermembrane recepter protein
LDAEPSAQNHLTFQGDAYGGSNDVLPGGQGSPRERGYSRGGNVLGRWTHVFAEESDLSLQLYYDRTHLDAPFQGAGAIPAGTLQDDLDTYDLDFQDRFGLGERHRIVWGLGYRFTHDLTESAPLVAFLPKTLERHLYSGFIQDEIKLHERLFLTLGSKLEHNDYTGWEYEPNVRLRWDLTDKQMVWGAISRAIRTPSRYDRDLFQPDPAYGELLVGNSTFDSETVIAYELGYRTEINSRISGSLSAFYNDYEHLRSLNTSSSGGLPLRFENNLQGQTYGFELGVNYQALDWWRLHAGYNLLKEHITVESGGDLANGLGETADPQQQIFLHSSMDLPFHLQLEGAFRWIDTVYNNNVSTVGTIPSYAELDLRVAWHPTTTLELSITGQNLLHDQHPEAGFPGPAQEEIARSVYGKVAWRF